MSSLIWSLIKIGFLVTGIRLRKKSVSHSFKIGLITSLIILAIGIIAFIIQIVTLRDLNIQAGSFKEFEALKWITGINLFLVTWDLKLIVGWWFRVWNVHRYLVKREGIQQIV
jgi:hypothetical protein